MTVMKIETYRTEKQQYAMNPKKFMLWAFLVTITIMFAGFTSAMLVSRPDAIANGRWRSIEIPDIFMISTGIIVLSSVAMQWAYIAARRNEIDQTRIALWITVLLGAAFVTLQWMGYGQLAKAGIFLDGSMKGADGQVYHSIVSGSFFYVISGIHALHVIGGVLFLGATLVSAYGYRVHSRNLLRINLCTTYWHFIGALWVYLFALLTIYA